MASRVVVLVFCFCFAGVAHAMFPLAMLAQQPVWQAGHPIPVNVDYDVPAAGPLDELDGLRAASLREYRVSRYRAILAKASAMEPPGPVVSGGGPGNGKSEASIEAATSLPKRRGT